LAIFNQLQKAGQRVVVRVLAVLAEEGRLPQVVQRLRPVQAHAVVLAPLLGCLDLTAQGVASSLFSGRKSHIRIRGRRAGVVLGVTRLGHGVTSWLWATRRSSYYPCVRGVNVKT